MVSFIGVLALGAAPVHAQPEYLLARRHSENQRLQESGLES
jgi:hypothetical protein